MTRSRAERGALFAAVTASGAGGLVWEIVWQHHATLALGASALGAAITLSGLMAGFAIGGILVGRLARRGRLSRPLRAYAWAELLVGGFALLVPGGMQLLGLLDSALFPSHPGLALLAQWLGTALLLLVPSAAMGATIPILAPCAQRFGTRVAVLYGLNTVGAVTGVLLATFALLPLFGVRATAAAAAIVDLSVALWAFRAAPLEASAQEETEAPSPRGSALALAFASGLAIFTLEISWFRSLRAAYQSSTETFAILLGAFLLPLSAGAWLAARLRTRRSEALSWLLPLAAVGIFCATPAIDQLDRLVAFEQGTLWVLPQRFLIVLAIVSVPVTLLGTILPILLEEHTSTIGSGRLYAANTAGAVVGALGAAFVLLPQLGATRTSWLTAAVLLAYGVVRAATRGELGLRRGFALVLLGALGIAVAISFDSGPGRQRVQGLRFAQFGRPLFIAEGPDATVSVVQGGRMRRLVIDGFEATGEWAAGNYMTWMGHLPALAATQLRNTLVICFGTGQTADAVRQHRPESLDIVDLSPAVFRAAPYFESNHGVLDDPSVHPRVMDGRAFLRRAAGRAYDLITLEPMAPYFAGTNNLYSREFYALIRSRLAPKGVVAQWVPFHLLSPEDMTAVVATFHEAFPYTRLWIEPMGHTGILIGSGAPWQLRRSAVVLPYTDEVVGDNMALDYRGVAMLSEFGEPITDDNQRLAYGYGRLSRFDVGTIPWGANVKGISLQIVKQLHQAELAP